MVKRDRTRATVASSKPGASAVGAVDSGASMAGTGSSADARGLDAGGATTDVTEDTGESVTLGADDNDDNNDNDDDDDNDDNDDDDSGNHDVWPQALQQRPARAEPSAATLPSTMMPATTTNARHDGHWAMTPATINRLP